MERRQIVDLWRRGACDVLVTLVRAEGSSYRRPGARLLMGVGGHAGTISGGCLEAEVMRKGTWMVRDGAVVHPYSMMFDDTAEIPFGLGCGGMVDLLLEPGGTPEFDALLHAMETSLHGAPARVATWLPRPGHPLRRAVFAPDGSVQFASTGLSAAELATPGGDVYVEDLAAPQRLMVFGAGDDARPLVGMAALLGWSVQVIDGRAQLTTAERFPAAERVTTSDAADAIQPGDAVVILTHSYEQDRAFLTAALASEARYIGLLGSRHRSSLLVRGAAAALRRPLTECCARMHAPVGLDLGGDGPEAIALSVIAEVQAVCQGKNAGLRWLTAEAVEEQIRLGGEPEYARAQCVPDVAPDAAQVAIRDAVE